MPGISRILLACLLAGMLPSCTGWPRGWKKARISVPADGLSGAWQGTWESGRNGHHGRLRCVVFPTADGKWEYRYRATWAGFLCAGFTVRCDAVPDAPGRWRVYGKKDLGPVFGGIFTYDARITGGTMRATYSAKADHGIMELRRIPPSGQTAIP